MNRQPDSPIDPQLVDEMTTLASDILDSRGQRLYDILIDGQNAFIDLLPAKHAASAYRIWTAITDLASAPGGPRSFAACDDAALAAAKEWLSLDRSSGVVVEAFFERWLSLLGMR